MIILKDEHSRIEAGSIFVSENFARSYGLQTLLYIFLFCAPGVGGGGV